MVANTTGSIFFASAWAWALPKMCDKLVKPLIKRGTLAWYIEIVIKFSGLKNEQLWRQA
jgi:hypothetical protein